MIIQSQTTRQDGHVIARRSRFVVAINTVEYSFTEEYLGQLLERLRSGSLAETDRTKLSVLISNMQDQLLELDDCNPS